MHYYLRMGTLVITIIGVAIASIVFLSLRAVFPFMYGIERINWEEKPKYEQFKRIPSNTLLQRISQMQNSNCQVIYQISGEAGFGNYAGGAVSSFAIALIKNCSFHILRNAYCDYFISFIPGLYMNQTTYKSLKGLTLIKSPSYREMIQPHGMDSLFKSKDLSITLYYDVLSYILKYYDGFSAFSHFGFDISGESFTMQAYTIRAGILRLLFNPIPPICEEVNRWSRRLTEKPLYCYQIRLGGNHAVKKEAKVFLLPKDVGVFVNRTKKVLQRNNLNSRDINLFISTDSVYAIDYVKEVFRNEMSIEYLSGVQRGHSALNHMRQENAKMVMYSTITDLLILKSCDILFSTHGSSFGNLGFSFGFDVKMELEPLPEMKSCSVYEQSNRKRIITSVSYNSSYPI